MSSRPSRGASPEWSTSSGKVASAVPIRIDDDGFLVGWHGHRLDEDFVLEGDRARRGDLALAYAATYLLPIFSVPQPARSAD